jgi:hypothetical protein
MIWAFFVGWFCASEIFPILYKKIEHKFLMDEMDRIIHKQELEEQKTKKVIRKSKVYKERLSTILKSINEASSEGKCSIEVMFLMNCPTDEEIRQELNKKFFKTSFPWNKKRTMKIQWKMPGGGYDYNDDDN